MHTATTAHTKQGTRMMRCMPINHRSAALMMSTCGSTTTVPEACDAIIQKGDTQHPVAENAKLYVPCYEVYTSLYPALKDVYKKLPTMP